MPLIVSILLPLAVDLIRSYIKNSDSSKDDLILETVQNGCSYLSKKDNNDVTVLASEAVSTFKMKGDY